MKHLFITVSAAMISFFAAAQEASLLKLDVEARVDYMQEYQRLFWDQRLFRCKNAWGLSCSWPKGRCHRKYRHIKD
jgi:hypothetical protein